MYENDEIEIDLLKMVKAMWKKAWLILLAAAILGGAMFAYGNATDVPTYTTSTTLYGGYVNNRDFAFGENAGNISQNSLSESRSIVNTCIAMLKTRMTQEAVLEEAGLEMTASKLSGMITTAVINNSELFTVTVTASDAQQAALIANAIGEVLPKQVAMVNSNSVVGVIDEALVPESPNPNGIVKDAVMAAVLGAFAVCAVIAVKCVVDDFKAAKKKQN